MGNVNCVNCCEPLRHEVVKAKCGSRSPDILRSLPQVNPSGLDSPPTGRNPTQKVDIFEVKQLPCNETHSQKSLKNRTSLEAFRMKRQLLESRVLTKGRLSSNANPSEYSGNNFLDDQATVCNPLSIHEEPCFMKNGLEIEEPSLELSQEDSVKILDTARSVDFKIAKDSSRDRMVKFVVKEAKVSQSEAMNALEKHNYNAVEAVLALS